MDIEEAYNIISMEVQSAMTPPLVTYILIKKLEAAQVLEILLSFILMI